MRHFIEEYLMLTLFLAAIALLSVSIYTDEYYVENKRTCVKYSPETGNCITNTYTLHCVTEWEAVSVFECIGKDITQCVKACGDYQKEYRW